MSQGESGTQDDGGNPSIVFEVSEYRTLRVLGAKDPEVYSEVFDVSPNVPAIAERIIDEVELAVPLVARFQELALSAYEQLSEELEELDDDEQARAEEFIESFDEDSEDAWKAWVEYLDEDGLKECIDEIRAWLEAPIDWEYSEFLPTNFGPYGQALEFFEGLDGDILDEIGISLIYGDAPGSSYCAAELDGSVEEANKQAQALGLDFRFAPERKPSADVASESR